MKNYRKILALMLLVVIVCSILIYFQFNKKVSELTVTDIYTELSMTAYQYVQNGGGWREDFTIQKITKITIDDFLEETFYKNRTVVDTDEFDYLIDKIYRKEGIEYIYNHNHWQTQKNARQELFQLELKKYLTKKISSLKKKAEYEIEISKEKLQEIVSEFYSSYYLTSFIITRNANALIKIENDNIKSIEINFENIKTSETTDSGYKDIKLSIEYSYDGKNEITIPKEALIAVAANEYETEMISLIRDYHKKYANNNYATIKISDLVEKGYELKTLKNCDENSFAQIRYSSIESYLDCPSYHNLTYSSVEPKTIIDKVLIYNIFVDDLNTTYNESQKKEIMSYINESTVILTHYAKTWGKDIRIVYNNDLNATYKLNNIIPTNGSFSSESIYDYEINNKIVNSVLPESKKAELKAKYKVDDIFVIINTSKEGRSFALPHQNLTIIYSPLTATELEYTYVHEIMHLFGATDLYNYSSEIIKKYFPTDIMAVHGNPGKLTVGQYSAYLNGWADYLNAEYNSIVKAFN